jgi:putative endonuclease
MYSNYYYIYILASKPYGTLYIGVTNDLVRRVWEHKNGFVEGFTKNYNVHLLVYYEQCESVESTITREKQLKKWKRRWKLDLIEKMNPGWKDLYTRLPSSYKLVSMNRPKMLPNGLDGFPRARERQ